MPHYEQLMKDNHIESTKDITTTSNYFDNTVVHDVPLEENKIWHEGQLYKQNRENATDPNIENKMVNINPRKSTEPYHRPSTKPKNISCSLCDYKIHRNDLLKLHMNSKHNAEKFPCQVYKCGKVYSSKINLKHHMRSNHECNVCGNQVATMNELKIHKLREHNIAP